MEDLPTNITDLEETFPISLLTKITEIPIYPSVDVLKSTPGFMPHMDFAVFNVEIIRVFTSTFVAICSATSHFFEFPYRSKRPPLEILKFLVTTLINQSKKILLVWVYEDGAQARYSEFMMIFHNMNIIVQTKLGYAYSLNVKTERPNNTLANITRALLMNSSQNK